MFSSQLHYQMLIHLVNDIKYQSIYTFQTFNLVDNIKYCLNILLKIRTEYFRHNMQY